MHVFFFTYLLTCLLTTFSDYFGGKLLRPPAQRSETCGEERLGSWKTSDYKKHFFFSLTYAFFLTYCFFESLQGPISDAVRRV